MTALLPPHTPVPSFPDIHRAAGPGLRDECLTLPEDERGNRCPTGEAVVTGAHSLYPRVKHIVHTVSCGREPPRSRGLSPAASQTVRFRVDFGSRSLAASLFSRLSPPFDP